MTCDGADVRRTESGELIDVTMLRGFARAALEHDAVCDEVHAMLFAHVVNGSCHRSVIAESLRPMIDELLDTMTAADWQFVVDEMIVDARESLDVSRASRAQEGCPPPNTCDQ